MKTSPLDKDTIAALSTAPGVGAIAVIRVNGSEAFKICSKIFRKKNAKSTDISKLESHTAHYGDIVHKSIVIDDVVLTVFKAPNSFTGENIVEIACHGSSYIQQQLLQLLVKEGCRLASPGEFTFRAFLNGKFDLTQAEAVADLIASHSSTSHHVAMQQMRGGFSGKIKVLRDSLIDFASLVELELDFSEEDVEFASKSDLKKHVISMQAILDKLVRSFELGNVIKNGVPVCIAGRPNAGKSTLLNALLDEDRAIVSDIPGTTRDTIEDEIVLEGVRFRFIDTAGLRATTDSIETQGIARTHQAMKLASVVIYLFDVHELSSTELQKELDQLKQHMPSAELIVTGNKIDKEDIGYTKKEFAGFKNILFISSKEKQNLEELKTKLIDIFDDKSADIPETIITNARHVEALQQTFNALTRVKEGLDKKISGELLASDIRDALHYLGLITGEVSTDDLLQNIFSRFCIGK
ncbi:MAG: tRNA uridine-5-carboxymethylaminomethyl(34) synthesis GTPase MnmE [Bacteroidetes bacterium]|nr:MAG: tRNA uridine-5-carboxymethylaminomethyl(34) synthesis GTPase MnmE [Bacteroidota bacterium]